MVIVQTTPRATPFAMTMPMSRPRVRRMVHRARKPAMVVMLEAVTEEKVFTMAVAIACSLSELRCFSSS